MSLQRVALPQMVSIGLTSVLHAQHVASALFSPCSSLLSIKAAAACTSRGGSLAAHFADRKEQAPPSDGSSKHASTPAHKQSMKMLICSSWSLASGVRPPSSAELCTFQAFSRAGQDEVNFPSCVLPVEQAESLAPCTMIKIHGAFDSAASNERKKGARPKWQILLQAPMQACRAR